MFIITRLFGLFVGFGFEWFVFMVECVCCLLLCCFVGFICLSWFGFVGFVLCVWVCCLVVLLFSAGLVVSAVWMLCGCLLCVLDIGVYFITRCWWL